MTRETPNPKILYPIRKGGCTPFSVLRGQGAPTSPRFGFPFAGARRFIGCWIVPYGSVRACERVVVFESQQPEGDQVSRQVAAGIARISESAHAALIERGIPPHLLSRVQEDQMLARITMAMWSGPEAGLSFRSDRGGSKALVVALNAPDCAKSALTALLFPDIARAALRLAESKPYERKSLDVLPVSVDFIDVWIAMYAPHRRFSRDRAHFKRQRASHARFSQCARETLPVLLENTDVSAWALSAPSCIRDAFRFMDGSEPGDTTALPVLSALSAPHAIASVLSTPENALDMVNEARLAGQEAAARVKRRLDTDLPF